MLKKVPQLKVSPLTKLRGAAKIRSGYYQMDNSSLSFMSDHDLLNTLTHWISPGTQLSEAIGDETFINVCLKKLYTFLLLFVNGAKTL